MGKAAAKYAAAMTPEVAAYLKGRGIEKDAAIAAQLGVCGDPEPGHERFRGCLSIPYVLPVGVVALKFRRLEGDGPKYDGPAGATLRLYNAGVLKDGGPVLAVCEGELDAVKVQQDLGIAAVATPGTNWQPHWGRAMADFDRIIVVADSDAKDDGSNPGLKHAKRVAKAVEGDLVVPPAGLDATDWLLRDGVEAVAREMGLA